MVPGWASGSGELDLIELAELIDTEELERCLELDNLSRGRGVRSIKSSSFGGDRVYFRPASRPRLGARRMSAFRLLPGNPG
jgi:hypothetical protein